MPRPTTFHALWSFLKSVPRQLVRRLSLRTVFTIPFVLLIVVTVGLTGYLAFLSGQKEF